MLQQPRIPFPQVQSNGLYPSSFRCAPSPTHGSQDAAYLARLQQFKFPAVTTAIRYVPQALVHTTAQSPRAVGSASPQRPPAILPSASSCESARAAQAAMQPSREGTAPGAQAPPVASSMMEPSLSNTSASASQGTGSRNSSMDAERAPKAKRKRITPEQLAVLVSLFQQTDTPSYEVRDQIGAQIGMTNRECQVWFQNRRAKERTNRQRQQHARLSERARDNQPFQSQVSPTDFLATSSASASGSEATSYFEAWTAGPFPASASSPPPAGRSLPLDLLHLDTGRRRSLSTSVLDSTPSSGVSTPRAHPYGQTASSRVSTYRQPVTRAATASSFSVRPSVLRGLTHPEASGALSRPRFDRMPSSYASTPMEAAAAAPPPADPSSTLGFAFPSQSVATPTRDGSSPSWLRMNVPQPMKEQEEPDSASIRPLSTPGRAYHGTDIQGERWAPPVLPPPNVTGVALPPSYVRQITDLSSTPIPQSAAFVESNPPEGSLADRRSNRLPPIRLLLDIADRVSMDFTPGMPSPYSPASTAQSCPDLLSPFERLDVVSSGTQGRRSGYSESGAASYFDQWRIDQGARGSETPPPGSAGGYRQEDPVIEGGRSS